jgi:uncharacterized protein YjeT (DUF2065 family)
MAKRNIGWGLVVAGAVIVFAAQGRRDRAHRVENIAGLVCVSTGVVLALSASARRGRDAREG